MHLGILSDSHDELERVERAVRLLQAAGAEALIHCGDLNSPPILAACAVLPCYFTFGNHDADDVPQLREAATSLGATSLEWGGVVTLAGKRIGVTHGHMRTDLRRIFDQQPLHYLLTGHSHVADDRQQGGLRRINPGALHRADRFTVALLNLSTEELRWITVDP